MRILVCGGRDFYDWNLLKETLDNTFWYDNTNDDFVLIEGGAIGADFLSKAWLSTVYKRQYLEDNIDKHLKEFPADWKTHGKAAGPIRNQQMLDEGKPDLVVAFPGGTGTADMIRRARKAGIEVKEITY